MESGSGVGKSGAWEILELGNWASSSAAPPAIASPSSSNCSPFPDHPVVPAIFAPRSGGDHRPLYQFPQQTQPHSHHQLTCLKLGKRQYYGAGAEDAGASSAGAGGGSVKKERSGVGAVVPRCQVEGCNKPLVDAKDYHRRHKVCEIHSKAPKVVVLGAEQRFCQQCSRFHLIAEFDEAKRSCRRRLAGHNERRRKSSSDSIVRNPPLDSAVMGGRYPYVSPTSPGRALSLLSSKASPWVSTPDLSLRSSAALRELIAENRASLLARQLFSEHSWQSSGLSHQSIFSCMPHQHHLSSQPSNQLDDGWNQFPESTNHVTLDLMQTPDSSPFEFLSGRSKSKEEEEECCEIWKSLEGTHVV